jgi:multidrug efflux system membrane fusion protein
VVRKDQTVEVRPLKVGQIDGGWALVEDGLKDGEIVVVDGQYKLQAGTPVVAAGPTGGPGAGAAKAAKPPQA